MSWKNILEDPKQYMIYLEGRILQGSKEADEKYLKKLFKYRMGRELDLDHPQALNDKLQWLKINDFKPIYTKFADKYAVREYIAQKVGEKYLVPLLGVWNEVDDIDFNSLPDQFVLKCTHDSGGVVICKDKSNFDKETAIKKLKHCYKRNYYLNTREPAYKDIEPRVIAEQFMVDETGWDLKDYKIFCFNGKPVYVEVDYNRSVKHMLNAYDLDWNFLEFCDSSPNNRDADIPKPQRLDEMLEIAKVLSKDMTFLRVDMYSIYDKIYCGELTLYPGSGFIQFNPMKTDYELGKLLRLPIDK